MCQPDRRAQLVRESVAHVNIYSFGSFVHDGRSCSGYLYELQGDKGTRAYVLHGYGSCAGFTSDGIKAIFHPKRNPSGIQAGDYIRTTLKYDGALPKKWNYFGTEYPFYASQEKPAGKEQQAAVQKGTNSGAQATAASSASGDVAVRYAENLIANFLAMPHCVALAKNMRTVASGSSPAQVRTLQIDRMFDSADRAGCVVY